MDKDRRARIKWWTGSPSEEQARDHHGWLEALECCGTEIIGEDAMPNVQTLNNWTVNESNNTNHKLDWMYQGQEWLHKLMIKKSPTPLSTVGHFKFMEDLNPFCKLAHWRDWTVSTANKSSDHTNLYTAITNLSYLFTCTHNTTAMQRQNIQSIVTFSVTLTVTNNSLW